MKKTLEENTRRKHSKKTLEENARRKRSRLNSGLECNSSVRTVRTTNHGSMTNTCILLNYIIKLQLILYIASCLISRTCCSAVRSNVQNELEPTNGCDELHTSPNEELPATCEDETEESTTMKKSISDNIHTSENDKYDEEETEDDSEGDETEETEYHLLKEQEALLKNIKTVMKLQDKIMLDKSLE